MPIPKSTPHSTVHHIVSPTNAALLGLRRLPGRTDKCGAAAILGFSEAEITILLRAGLLKSLGGERARSAPKWFSTASLFALVANESALSEMTEAVSAYHRIRNDEKKSARRPSTKLFSDDGHAVPGVQSFAA